MFEKSEAEANPSDEPLGSERSVDQTQTTELAIHGMTCASCVARVEKTLSALPGVTEAMVNFATEVATVHHNANIESVALKNAVKTAGYGAQVISPAHESDSHPNHEGESHHHPSGAAHEAHDHLAPEPNAWRSFLLAAGLSAVVVPISMFWMNRPGLINWGLLGLTALIVFGAGSRYHRATWNAARHRSTTMDTLVSLGTLAALAISAYAMIRYPGGSEMQNHHLYLDSAAVILTFLLLGKHFELRSRERLKDAVSGLLHLVPQTAHVMEFPSSGGNRGLQSHSPKVQDQAASSVATGTLIRIKAGERIPLDATVVTGSGFVDESMLSGEPMPVEKGPGGQLYAGTVNASGVFTARVIAGAGSSRLMQIVHAVQRAQGSKSPVQKIADKVAAVFVPIVIAIAIGQIPVHLFLGWGLESSLITAVSVLVIACPCALGLAVPTALMVGIGQGARFGILLKDATTLQHSAEIKTILLDKTGTITEGRPSLVQVELLNSDLGTIEDAFGAALALEQSSEHPLAHAFTRLAQEKGCLPGLDLSQGTPTKFEVSSVEILPGKGLQGKHGAVNLSVLSLNAAEQLGALTSAEMDRLGQGFVGEVTVVVLCRKDAVLETQAWAAFGIADSLKTDAADAIRALKALGVNPIILSGDAEPVVASVAAKVGIDAFVAEVSPEQKQAVVEKYREVGAVGMVGDGINDAPALAAAHVSFAMGAGSDIAQASAGVTILNNHLSSVVASIQLSRATMAIIRSNLVWAFGYNVVMIPLAAAGRLSPMLAALAMALSSVSVVLNSLRLNSFSGKAERQ